LSAPSFPRAISLPDFLPITVEPGTANEEIIWLVGWSPGGTTGLVVRNAEVSDYGSGAITHTSVAWQHGPTNLDFHIARSAAVASKMAFR
jgi:hypothetical protein